MASADGAALTAVLGLPSEAFYVLLGAVVGAVASLVATWFKEWLDCRHLRKRVATLLRIEIRAQAAASLAIASLANLLRKETRQQPELDARRYLVKYIPPQPAVYPGLVSDIGALPFDKATAVVEFYGAIDRAITLTHTLAAKWEHLDVNARDRSSEGTLARRWQAVASRRAVAIRELRKITEDPSPEDALALAALLKELWVTLQKAAAPDLLRQNLSTERNDTEKNALLRGVGTGPPRRRP